MTKIRKSRRDFLESGGDNECLLVGNQYAAHRFRRPHITHVVSVAAAFILPLTIGAFIKVILLNAAC
jgi:hypothetical protein